MIGTLISKGLGFGFLVLSFCLAMLFLPAIEAIGDGLAKALGFGAPFRALTSGSLYIVSMSLIGGRLIAPTALRAGRLAKGKKATGIDELM